MIKTFVKVGAVALLLLPAGCMTKQVEKKPNTQQGKVLAQMLEANAERNGTGMDLREKRALASEIFAEVEAQPTECGEHAGTSRGETAFCASFDPGPEDSKSSPSLGRNLDKYLWSKSEDGEILQLTPWIRDDETKGKYSSYAVDGRQVIYIKHWKSDDDLRRIVVTFPF